MINCYELVVNTSVVMFSSVPGFIIVKGEEVTMDLSAVSRHK